LNREENKILACSLFEKIGMKRCFQHLRNTNLTWYTYKEFLNLIGTNKMNNYQIETVFYYLSNQRNNISKRNLIQHIFYPFISFANILDLNRKKFKNYKKESQQKNEFTAFITEMSGFRYKELIFHFFSDQ